MPRYKGVPKFWDEEKQRVVEGVEIRNTPTQLVDMLGTYVWVYSGDHEFPGDVEEMYRSDYEDDTAFITRYGMTLGVAKDGPDRPVAPEKVEGHVSWDMYKAAFDGVRRVKEGWSPDEGWSSDEGRSSDEAVPWKESHWEVLITDDHYDDDEGVYWEQGGNTVRTAVVLDDNECPFLVFDWSHPYSGHGSWSGYYVGKRLVEGKDWRLTDEERGRLGIGRTFRRVERSVKAGSPRVYTEDEGACSDGEEAGEVREEDKGVGKKTRKRKVNNADKGANKRRRA